MSQSTPVMSEAASALRHDDLYQLLRDKRIDFAPGFAGHTVHFDLESLECLNTSEETHFWSAVKRCLALSLIRKYISKKDFDLLDVGCGNGSFLWSVENAFPEARVAGFDGYPEALLHCRLRTTKARLGLGDINSIGSAPARPEYDVIAALDVLEHLDQPRKVAEALSRFLKPGGILIVTVPAHQFLWSSRDVFLRHRKRYSKKELVTLLQGFGLKILWSNYCFSSLFLPAIFFRKFLFRWKKMSGENMEKTELKKIPLLNDLLKFIGCAEVKLSQYMPLPFGTSVYCVARKTDAAAIQ